MSSNAVSNQPTTNFFSRALKQVQEKLGIKDVVESSNKPEKLTAEGKEAYKAAIEKALSEIDPEKAIQEKEATDGILRSKVFTLDNTSLDDVQKMSKVLNLVSDLIQRSGGVDKTFLAQSSADPLKDRILELALIVSDTKNEDNDASRVSLKSSASTVVEQAFPKLLSNGKTGLTQDETQAIKMMLFSNNDAAAFAGALKLLQSVKNYEEVAPDSVKEKKLSDDTMGLSVNSGSVYKKILNAVGSNATGNHVVSMLKGVVDRTLHGRLTQDELNVLKTDPSLKNTYDTVHRALINTIQQRTRENIINPLKENLKDLSNNKLIQQYFSDSSVGENKILELVKKTVKGIINMAQSSGNEFSKRAFGEDSFYDSNLKLTTLTSKLDSQILNLNTLENRVTMVRDRMDQGYSTRLDIPLDVIAKKSPSGASTARALIRSLAKEAEMYADHDPEALNKWATKFAAAVHNPGQITGLQDGNQDATITSAVIDAMADKETKVLDSLLIRKVNNTDSMKVIQVTLGAHVISTNAEGASKLVAAYRKLNAEQEAGKEGYTLAQNFAKAFVADNSDSANKTLKEQLSDIQNGIASDDAVKKFTSALARNDGDLVTYHFGLDTTKRNTETTILKSLEKLAPETRDDLVSIRTSIEESTTKAADLIKSEAKAVPHLALTTSQAIIDGLTKENGEKFQVSNSLATHLFKSAQVSIQQDANSAYNKLQDQKFQRLIDIEASNKELSNLSAFTSNIKMPTINNNNYQSLVKDINTLLNASSTDKQVTAFKESFKNANSDLLEEANYKGDKVEDQARFNLLMKGLLNSALELQDNNPQGSSAILTGANLAQYFQDTKIIANEFQRTEMDRIADGLSGIIESVSSNNAELTALNKIRNGSVKSFNALSNLGNDTWQQKILKTMVDGFLGMAKTAAVKLSSTNPEQTSLKDMIMKAGESSNKMEQLFQSSLISAMNTHGASV